MLLARLGLRAGEVAAMTLDDIDWRAGDVVIRGEGPRMDRLPLPSDVGDALAAYLRDGRPTVDDRRLFITKAPMGGMSRASVTEIVSRAAARVGLFGVGPHRLRHSAATAMLRCGASLPEIGQVLRHRHVDTTAVYAKVDQPALSLVARSWPGASA
jgi:integrase/recombinase XerD